MRVESRLSGCRLWRKQPSQNSQRVEPFAKFGIEHLHKTTEERTCPASHLSPAFSWEGCRCQVNSAASAHGLNNRRPYFAPENRPQWTFRFCARLEYAPTCAVPGAGCRPKWTLVPVLETTEPGRSQAPGTGEGVKLQHTPRTQKGPDAQRTPGPSVAYPQLMLYDQQSPPPNSSR